MPMIAPTDLSKAYRRSIARGDPRRHLDSRMRELLDRLDKIPYERPAGPSASDD